MRRKACGHTAAGSVVRPPARAVPRSGTSRYASLHNFSVRCLQTLGWGALYAAPIGPRREVMFIVIGQVWARRVGDAVGMLADFCIIGHDRGRSPSGVGRQRDGTKSPRAPTATMGSGPAQRSSRALKLTVLDAAGTELQIAFRRCPGKIEVWSSAGSCLAVFNRTRLVSWLKHPCGRMADRAVSLTSSVDGIVLDVAPLFVSQLLSQRYLDALSRFASAATLGRRRMAKW